MTNDVIIPRKNETPRFTQEALKYFNAMQEDLAKQDAQFMSPASYVGAGAAAAKVGLGIAGFFNKTPELPRMESTYNIDPNLVNTANAATAKAFDTTDDYAGRIRLRNQRIAQTLSGVGMSGGDRNFVAATENAARDTENIGNLQTDLENKKMQQAQLGVAANLQQMALFDRLNKSREEMQAADFNLKAQLAEIAERSKNISGAAGLIASGINDAVGIAGNEMTADAMRGYQKIALFNALSKLNMEQESNANKSTQKLMNELEAQTPVPFLEKPNNVYAKFFENQNPVVNVEKKNPEQTINTTQSMVNNEILTKNSNLEFPEVKWNPSLQKFVQPEQFVSLKPNPNPEKTEFSGKEKLQEVLNNSQDSFKEAVGKILSKKSNQSNNYEITSNFYNKGSDGKILKLNATKDANALKYEPGNLKNYNPEAIDYLNKTYGINFQPSRIQEVLDNYKENDGWPNFKNEVITELMRNMENYTERAPKSYKDPEGPKTEQEAQQMRDNGWKGMKLFYDLSLDPHQIVEEQAWLKGADKIKAKAIMNYVLGITDKKPY